MSNTSIDLNIQQKIAFDSVKDGNNILITGPAGTGKSLLIQHIVQWCKDNNREVAITAITGVAAANIDGTTLHSWASIGLGKNNASKHAYYVKKSTGSLTKYLETDVLIVDEISMIDFAYLQKVNEVAKILRKSRLPFGGIQLIFTGDFFQLGPVNVEKYVFEDKIWDELIDTCIHLTKIYRQKSTEFVNLLYRLRTNTLNDEDVSMIQATQLKTLKNDLGIIPTILFCRNIDVDSMNKRELSKLKDSEYVCFDSTDDFKDEDNKRIYENSFTFVKKLELKVGAQVMLIKNLDTSEKLVNGSRGIIKEILGNKSVVVQFLNGLEKVIVEEVQQFKDDAKGHDSEIFASRKQLPLKLAYALTIHKSQGLSIDYLHVDLRGCFASGQAYVAMSRATSFDTIKVTNFTPKCVIVSERVLNFYKEIDEGKYSKKRKRQGENAIQTYFIKKNK